MVDNSSAIWLITGFFVLILGVVLLTTIASQEQEVVTKTLASNESFDMLSTPCREVNGTGINTTACNNTVTYAPTGWKLSDIDNPCPLTDFALRNCTGDVLTITTDYVVALSTGTYQVLNTSQASCGAEAYTGEVLENFSYSTYSYCSDDYLTQSWSRTLMDTVVGFFAIALMITSVGIFYNIAKKEGLIGI